MTEDRHQTDKNVNCLWIVLQLRSEAKPECFEKIKHRRRNYAKKYVRQALESVCVVSEGMTDHFTVHGLSSTYITFLLEAGHQMQVTSRNSGYRDPRYVLIYHNTDRVLWQKLKQIFLAKMWPMFASESVTTILKRIWTRTSVNVDRKVRRKILVINPWGPFVTRKVSKTSSIWSCSLVRTKYHWQITLRSARKQKMVGYFQSLKVVKARELICILTVEVIYECLSTLEMSIY